MGSERREKALPARPLFIAMLTMMSVSGLIATDVFLPALPDIAHRFSVTPSGAQLMLSTFLLGLASMQLVYGPVSDALGRRRVLVGGFVVFAAASFAIMVANGFTQVVILRLVQAIGAAAGLTLGRAIVGDLYDREEAGRVFLLIFPVVGMSPAIAPMIGGILHDRFGWRACFLFTAAFASVLTVLVLLFLPETKPPGTWSRLTIRDALGNYRTLLQNPKFRRFAAIPCVAYAAYFAYIAESPFLLTAQGMGQQALGYSYISLSAMYVIGNLVARRLMKSRSVEETLGIGYRIFLAGGLAVLVATAVRPDSFALGIAAISALTLGNGFLLPLGTAGAVTADLTLAGSASGLMGSLQLASAAFAAQIVGAVTRHRAPAFGVVIAAIAVIGFSLHARAPALMRSSPEY